MARVHDAPGSRAGHVALSDEAQQALAEQVRAACVAWFSQAGIVQLHEADFGLRLARCPTPSDAVAVCGEWLAHRLDSAVVLHHRLLELWLAAVNAAEIGAVLAERRDAADEGRDVT